nr:zonular occludens toxin [Vibrio cholerae]
MSIFIHHGAPGSYKTSGALWLRLLPAIKSGRHIITNVRGL